MENEFRGAYNKKDRPNWLIDSFQTMLPIDYSFSMLQSKGKHEEPKSSYPGTSLVVVEMTVSEH